LLNERGTNVITGKVTSTLFSFIGVAGSISSGGSGNTYSGGSGGNTPPINIPSALTLNTLAGTGMLKVGAGALTLAGNSPNYQGPTTVLSGTLTVSAENALGPSGSDDGIVNDGATLSVGQGSDRTGAPVPMNLGAALTLGGGSTLQLGTSDTWIGPVSLGGASANIDIPSGAATIAGDISGINGAGLTVTGSLTLSGFDTYNGATLIVPNSGTFTPLGFLGNRSVFFSAGDTIGGGPNAVLEGLFQSFLASGLATV
jgi:autotransporter-associated beta strand protein